MILSLLSSPLPPSALCTVFGERSLPCPVTSRCGSLSPYPVSSGLSLFSLFCGVSGDVLLWGGGSGVGVGLSHPDPSFPLRRKILAQGGSLLCRCTWCGWFWPLASAGPHIPVCPGRSCMLFASLMALAGAAVVHHARSARRQTKGSGPGLVPLGRRLRTRASSPSQASPQLG